MVQFKVLGEHLVTVTQWLCCTVAAP